MRKLSLVGCALVLSLVLETRDADAALMTFFGEDTGLGENEPLPAHPLADEARASFLANLTTPGTENFESFSVGTSSPLDIIFPGAGGVTATLIDTGGEVKVTQTPIVNGRYAISGLKYWEIGPGFGVNFSEPVAAFGFYGVDIGDFGGQVILTLAGDGAQSINIGNTIGAPGGGVTYFGIIETLTFTAVTFGTAIGVDVFAFDDMTVGSLAQVNPIPEPASLALFGLGLGGVGFMRRRKKAIA